MEPRHLFLDLHDLTRIERLHRRVHQPQRHPQNPILRGENPWEAVASLYGTVLYDPADEEGVALSKPMRVTGDELHVNVDSARGQLVVALTDDEGRRLPDYTSAPIAVDQTDDLVHFAQSLGALAGREVRVRLELRNASLYSYWFA